MEPKTIYDLNIPRPRFSKAVLVNVVNYGDSLDSSDSMYIPHSTFHTTEMRDGGFSSAAEKRKWVQEVRKKGMERLQREKPGTGKRGRKWKTRRKKPQLRSWERKEHGALSEGLRVQKIREKHYSLASRPSSSASSFGSSGRRSSSWLKEKYRPVPTMTPRPPIVMFRAGGDAIQRYKRKQTPHPPIAEQDDETKHMRETYYHQYDEALHHQPAELEPYEEYHGLCDFPPYPKRATPTPRMSLYAAGRRASPSASSSSKPPHPLKTGFMSAREYRHSDRPYSAGASRVILPSSYHERLYIEALRDVLRGGSDEMEMGERDPPSHDMSVRDRDGSSVASKRQFSDRPMSARAILESAHIMRDGFLGPTDGVRQTIIEDVDDEDETVDDGNDDDVKAHEDHDGVIHDEDGKGIPSSGSESPFLDRLGTPERNSTPTKLSVKVPELKTFGHMAPLRSGDRRSTTSSASHVRRSSPTSRSRSSPSQSSPPSPIDPSQSVTNGIEEYAEHGGDGSSGDDVTLSPFRLDAPPLVTESMLDEKWVNAQSMRSVPHPRPPLEHQDSAVQRFSRRMFAKPNVDGKPLPAHSEEFQRRLVDSMAELMLKHQRLTIGRASPSHSPSLSPAQHSTFASLTPRTYRYHMERKHRGEKRASKELEKGGSSLCLKPL
eukprot:TRINITY_DN2674_c0_g1_i1.p1 TRINITY_DN2674_c0_g1~~TRINITY_DN2674_c0_g1_i1.p1  ORF type:complete len:662 (-),score=195.78 TRINITY_DN2674_c0_g1_i1:2672-4657(-)